MLAIELRLPALRKKVTTLTLTLIQKQAQSFLQLCSQFWSSYRTARHSHTLQSNPVTSGQHRLATDGCLLPQSLSAMRYVAILLTNPKHSTHTT
jgi:hypothetical protein